jgi:DNA primase
LKVPARDLVDAGLAYVTDAGRHNDFFRSRLLFPIFAPDGAALGAGGRILPGGRGPKYKNTANTAVYDKSEVLYGLNWAKKAIVDRDQIVVCEGYTDVIGLHRAGVEEAVATCGTALADGHIRRLNKFARRVILAYDADAAGQAAAERFYEWEQRFDVDIRVAALPAGADPADLARSDPDALKRAINEARPYLAFRLERLLGRADLSGPEGRVRAATAAVELIASHPNALVRDQYLMEVADRCRVPPAQLRHIAESPRRDHTHHDQPRHDQPRPGRAGADRPATNADDDRPEPVVISGTELEALTLAVHRPETVADRLQPALFAHPLAVRAFSALANAATLHDAIEDADPQTKDLLNRLAVEASDTDPDDVMVRLVERAGRRALDELLAEMRASPDPGGYADSVAWLKSTLELLRAPSPAEVSLEAEQRLVPWLVDRSQAGEG